MLDLNMIVMKELMKGNERISGDIASPPPGSHEHFGREVCLIWQESQMYHKSATNLLTRAASISQHVCRLLLAL